MTGSNLLNLVLILKLLRITTVKHVLLCFLLKRLNIMLLDTHVQGSLFWALSFKAPVQKFSCRFPFDLFLTFTWNWPKQEK